MGKGWGRNGYGKKKNQSAGTGKNVTPGKKGTRHNEVRRGYNNNSKRGKPPKKGKIEKEGHFAFMREDQVYKKKVLSQEGAVTKAEGGIDKRGGGANITANFYLRKSFQGQGKNKK